MPTPLELRNASLSRRTEILDTLFADSELEDFMDDPQALGADAKIFIQMFGGSTTIDEFFTFITTSATTFTGFSCKTSTGYVQVVNWNGVGSSIFGSGDPNATITPTFLAAASPYNTLTPKRISVRAVNAAGNVGASTIYFTQITLNNASVVACYGNLHNLTGMSISAQLTVFGGEYPLLENLTFTNTNIERLPKNLPNLRILNVISSSRIKFFKNVYPLLEELTLTSSALRKFIGDFPELTTLILNVTGDGIETFSGDFPVLTTLTFDSGYNSVKNFSGNFPLITSLTANGNGTFPIKMESFSGSFPKLQTLSLQNNAFTTFSGDYPELTSLSLQGNSNLTTYNAVTPKVEILRITESLISELDLDLPELNSLYIQNGALSSLSGNMPKLRILYLSGNELSGVFSGTYPLLRTCGLNDNAITGIIGNYPDLISLRLSNNLIETFDLSTITPVKVLGNPAEGLYEQGDLWLNGNPLTSVRAEGFAGFGITSQAFRLEDCDLSESALNIFFTDLDTGIDFIGTKPGIRVQGNPGAATCDTTIATAKNYTVQTA